MEKGAPIYEAHFKKYDPILFDVIKLVGPFKLSLERNRFGMLVRSILSQQLSTSAARTIRMRLESALGSAGITPDSILQFSPADMRPLGISQQKAEYILDLAEKALDGTLNLSNIGRKSDEQVIEQLTQVRGIGRWTAQMFLIFSLGRMDVFPHDDLGVRSAIRTLYQLDDLPDKAKCHAVAEKWRPYASVASWYCWRSIDIKREQKSA